MHVHWCSVDPSSAMPWMPCVPFRVQAEIAYEPFEMELMRNFPELLVHIMSTKNVFTPTPPPRTPLAASTSGSHAYPARAVGCQPQTRIPHPALPPIPPFLPRARQSNGDLAEIVN